MTSRMLSIPVQAVSRSKPNRTRCARRGRTAAGPCTTRTPRVHPSPHAALHHFARSRAGTPMSSPTPARACRGDGFVVVVQTHVERLDVLGVVVHDHRFLVHCSARCRVCRCRVDAPLHRVHRARRPRRHAESQSPRARHARRRSARRSRCDRDSPCRTSCSETRVRGCSSARGSGSGT